MMRLSTILMLCLLLAGTTNAQESSFQDDLLDHLAGNWLMQGTIAGNEVKHDIDIEWVLGHQYLRLTEVSREMKKDGVPEYEAIVFIGWDAQISEYACLWLDCTGGGGLSVERTVIGHAKRSGDQIPFVFEIPDGSAINNTFSYIRDNDTWEWHIVNEREGIRKEFARVTLTKK